MRRQTSESFVRFYPWDSTLKTSRTSRIKEARLELEYTVESFTGNGTSTCRVEQIACVAIKVGSMFLPKDNDKDNDPLNVEFTPPMC